MHAIVLLAALFADPNGTLWPDGAGEVRVSAGWAEADEGRRRADLRYRRLSASLGARIALRPDLAAELAVPWVEALHESGAGVQHRNRDLGDGEVALWYRPSAWHAAAALRAPLGDGREARAEDLPLSGDALPAVDDERWRGCLTLGWGDTLGSWSLLARAGAEVDLESGAMAQRAFGSAGYALAPEVLDVSVFGDLRGAFQGDEPRFLRLGLAERLVIGGDWSARLAISTRAWAEDAERETAAELTFAWRLP